MHEGCCERGWFLQPSGQEDGQNYENLGCYEDTGDMGNEYIYIQDTGKQVISTKGRKAEVSLRGAKCVPYSG